MGYTGIIPESMRQKMQPADRQAIGKPAMTNADAQVKIDRIRETKLQENIAAFLRQRNIWFMRQRMDRKTTGTLGAPDFLFAINGRACAFEVKLPGEHPTVEQAKCHDAMRDNGWLVFVVRSEREVVETLEGISRPVIGL